MPARNITLTDHLAAFVDRNVASGQFEDASDVMREGLRLLEQRQREDELKLQRLRKEVDFGREDARQGRVVRIKAGDEGGYLAGLGRTGSRAD